METHEALANAIGRNTTAHAKALGTSVSLVSKWKEPSTDFSDSGTINPLDRIETIMQTALSLDTEPDMALSPVYYLGQRFGFIPMLLPKSPPNLAEISRQLHKVIGEFSHVIKESSDALEDGRITPQERKIIEKEAQHLMSALGLFLSQIEAAAK